LENKDNIITTVKRGDEEAVKKLLVNDPSVANSHNKDAATPLMYASMLGHFNLVELLLEHGADINAKELIKIL
jgi:ankyrin repeat protein